MSSLPLRDGSSDDLSNKLKNIKPVENMWITYLASRDAESLNALIVHYLPLVNFAAARLYHRRGGQIDRDDLIQYGTLGLRDAIRHYDPARGAKFETYSSCRIRGAMLDGLKSNHWVPRDIRQNLTRYAAVQENLQAEFGEGDFEEEAACRLGLDPQAIHNLRTHSQRQSISSLHWDQSHGGPDGEEISRSASVPDHREENASDALHRQTVRDLFLRDLTRSERQLMMLYYYENMSMREVGAVLGISGTRVSQIHTDIVKRLRNRLGSRVLDETGVAQECMGI